MADAEQVTYSTDSAFHALGVAGADDLVVRADLMRSVKRIILQQGLTQIQAGQLMGMDQPRVSALLNGKISLFSTDRLLRAVRDLGQDIEVRIVPSSSGKGQMRVAA